MNQPDSVTKSPFLCSATSRALLRIHITLNLTCARPTEVLVTIPTRDLHSSPVQNTSHPLHSTARIARLDHLPLSRI